MPVGAPNPSTAMRYVVPAMTANATFDCCVPFVSSFAASCVSPVMLVPV